MAASRGVKAALSSCDKSSAADPRIQCARWCHVLAVAQQCITCWWRTCGKTAEEHVLMCYCGSVQQHGGYIQGWQTHSHIWREDGRRIFRSTFASYPRTLQWDGRPDNGVKKQQRQRHTSSGQRINGSNESDKELLAAVHDGLPTASVRVFPPTDEKTVRDATQELLRSGPFQRWTSLRPGRSSDMLKRPKHLPPITHGHSCSTSGGLFCTVNVISSRAYTTETEPQWSTRLGGGPRMTSDPARPLVGRGQLRQRVQLLHLLVQQQNACPGTVVIGRQTTNSAAAPSAGAGGGGFNVVSCQSLRDICKDTSRGADDNERKFDKHICLKKTGRMLLCRDNDFSKQNDVKKPRRKIGRLRSCGASPVLLPLLSSLGQVIELQLSTQPALRRARETKDATGKWQSPVPRLQAPRPAARCTTLADAAVAATPFRRPPLHDASVMVAPLSKIAAEAKPTSARAETTQLRINATRDTETNAEGDRELATEVWNSTTRLFTQLSDLAGTTVTELLGDMERRDSLLRTAALAQSLKKVSVPPATVLAGGSSARCISRPLATLIRPDMAYRKVSDQQQNRKACGFRDVCQLRYMWVPFAPYSSAAAEALAKETRTRRVAAQLSRKELKGLQGHPRRYQLMGGRPEFHHVDRNKNGHIIEPTDKFQVVMTTSKNNVHVQVLNKSRAYRTIFGSFAGNVGYRKRAQQEPQCAYRIGQNVARKCRRLGICQVDVKFRRIMRVEQLLQAFAAHGLGVTSITHEPCLPKCGQNSTKPRKRRRV